MIVKNTTAHCTFGGALNNPGHCITGSLREVARLLHCDTQ